MKKLVYICLISLVACNTVPKQKGLVYYNDFESSKGWTNFKLTKKVAHSGIFSNKVDTAQPYGATFKEIFKNISDDKVVKVKISIWIYPTVNAKGKFVVDIRDPYGKAMFWTSKNIEDVAPKPAEWQKFETDVTFPGDSVNRPDNIISIYPWSLSKSEFYVDDIRYEFVLGY